MAPDLLTFGEAVLTYKPAPDDSSASGLTAGASAVVQAVGGSELNVAVALAQLDSPANAISAPLRAGWVSMLPSGPLGDLVCSTASELGVEMAYVQRLPDTTIGTLHVVDDDGTGPRPLYQRRHSAFCTHADAASFEWAALLRGAEPPRWLFLTGITPLLSPGAASAWAAALEHVAAPGGGALGGSAAGGPYACVDLNHRPALGSLDDLWALVAPQLPKMTLLMLSEDSLAKLARRFGCWADADAGGDSTAAQHAAQRAAMSALRRLWKVPLLGCTFKRPWAEDGAASAATAAAAAPGAHKNVMAGGRIRRWSVVVFAGGEGSTEAVPVVHSPVQALGGGDAWVAGFLHAMMEACFHLPPGAAPGAAPADIGADAISELSSLLTAACRRGDLLAALQMRTHGDFSAVGGAELRHTEAHAAGAPYHMPPSGGSFYRRTDSLQISRSAAAAALPLPPPAPLAAPSAQASPSSSAVLLPAPPPTASLPSAASVYESLERCGIIPVVTVDDVAHAVPIAKALIAGGVRVIELTLRTAAGEAALREIATHVPSMLLGAGTVLSTAQAERAVACGAHFLVAPGTNAKVVRWAASRGVVMLPGVASATEIEAAMDLGLTTLKFFPAEPNGGLNMLKALSAPYTAVKWMPTGGISPANVGAYLANPTILCCGGSWLTPKAAVQSGEWAQITELAAEAAAAVLAARAK